MYKITPNIELSQSLSRINRIQFVLLSKCQHVNLVGSAVHYRNVLNYFKFYYASNRNLYEKLKSQDRKNMGTYRAQLKLKKANKKQQMLNDTYTPFPDP